MTALGTAMRAALAAAAGPERAPGKRRVSIISQVSFKKDTDRELLYANIEPNLADRNSFIRKAIGWALRSYAWTEPKEVARYVAANDARLSGLSKREALKNIQGRR